MKSLIQLAFVAFVGSALVACATAQPCPCKEESTAAHLGAESTSDEDRQEQVEEQNGEGETARISPIVQSFEEASRHLAPSKQTAITWLAEGENAYVGTIVLAPGTEVPPHSHDSEEYLLIAEGGGQMTIDGEVYELGPGMVVLVPTGTEHSFVNGDEVTRAFQVFSSAEGAQRFRQWPESDDLVAPAETD